MLETIGTTSVDKMKIASCRNCLFSFSLRLFSFRQNFTAMEQCCTDLVQVCKVSPGVINDAFGFHQFNINYFLFHFLECVTHFDLISTFAFLREPDCFIALQPNFRISIVKKIYFLIKVATYVNIKIGHFML